MDLNAANPVLLSNLTGNTVDQGIHKIKLERFVGRSAEFESYIQVKMQH